MFCIRIEIKDQMEFPNIELSYNFKFTYIEYRNVRADASYIKYGRILQINSTNYV